MIPQVSILVPIYNVSQYIERCAHSLFRQTFQHIEYIFVNDATPDDSIEKLQKVIECYPNRQKQVKVIHNTVNQGIGESRNTAINNSEGKYLLFVDSDDYIESNMVEQLYDKIETKQADIAVCDFFIENKKKSVVGIDEVFNGVEERLSNILKTTSTYTWNKLVRKDLYYHKDFKMPKGLRYCEDISLVVQLYFLTDKVVKVNKPLYHYVNYNFSSITATRNRMHFECAISVWNLVESLFQEHKQYNKYKDTLDFLKVNHKANMMLATNSYSLRKEYAVLWYAEETRCFNQLKRGRKIITYCIRHRLFALAQVYHWGTVIVNYFR